MKLKVVFADPSRRSRTLPSRALPAVLVVDTPDEDPYVILQGKAKVIQTSTYPLSKYCSPSELSEYATDHYSALAEQFEHGSDPWFHLMHLQLLLDERRQELEAKAI